MRDVEIRARVRERLANGTLRGSYVARESSALASSGSIRMTIGGGALNDSCAVCDEPGTDFRYDTDPPAAFHERCHAVWADEVRAPQSS